MTMRKINMILLALLASVLANAAESISYKIIYDLGLRALY